MNTDNQNVTPTPPATAMDLERLKELEASGKLVCYRLLDDEAVEESDVHPAALAGGPCLYSTHPGWTAQASDEVLRPLDMSVILSHIRELEKRVDELAPKPQQQSHYERGQTLHRCEVHDHLMGDGRCSCLAPDNQNPNYVKPLTYEEMRTQLTTTQAEAGRLREALRVDRPWPLWDIISNLCDAVEFAFQRYDMRPDGWEAWSANAREGRALVERLKAALSTPVEAEETKYSGHVPCKKCGQTHWMHGNCPTAPTEGGAK